jgi:hypothetical protein
MMRDSGTILRPTLTDDGAGGTTTGTPTEIGPILGMFWALSGDELLRAAQLAQLGRYRWAVPRDTDIQETDQVAILGATYNVVWAPPVAALDVERIVGLEEA